MPPKVNIQDTQNVIVMILTIRCFRKQLNPIKASLIDKYCRKCAECDVETGAYQACLGCEVNQILNLICEVMG